MGLERQDGFQTLTVWQEDIPVGFGAIWYSTWKKGRGPSFSGWASQGQPKGSTSGPAYQPSSWEGKQDPVSRVFCDVMPVYRQESVAPTVGFLTVRLRATVNWNNTALATR